MKQFISIFIILFLIIPPCYGISPNIINILKGATLSIYATFIFVRYQTKNKTLNEFLINLITHMYQISTLSFKKHKNIKLDKYKKWVNEKIIKSLSEDLSPVQIQNYLTNLKDQIHMNVHMKQLIINNKEYSQLFNNDKFNRLIKDYQKLNQTRTLYYHCCQAFSKFNKIKSIDIAKLYDNEHIFRIHTSIIENKYKLVIKYVPTFMCIPKRNDFRYNELLEQNIEILIPINIDINNLITNFYDDNIIKRRNPYDYIKYSNNNHDLYHFINNAMYNFRLKVDSILQNTNRDARIDASSQFIDLLILFSFFHNFNIVSNDNDLEIIHKLNMENDSENERDEDSHIYKEIFYCLDDMIKYHNDYVVQKKYMSKTYNSTKISNIINEYIFNLTQIVYDSSSFPGVIYSHILYLIDMFENFLEQYALCYNDAKELYNVK
jgi:hypothetical protein